MNKKELQETLNQEGFNSRYYDLDNGMLPDRFTLYNDGNIWKVFYFDERGIIRNEKFFATECEACEYFLAQMRDDPMAKS
jgi:hypothetical protein